LDRPFADGAMAGRMATFRGTAGSNMTSGI
jgi:hypothetical protein